MSEFSIFIACSKECVEKIKLHRCEQAKFRKADYFFLSTNNLYLYWDVEVSLNPEKNSPEAICDFISKQAQTELYFSCFYDGSPDFSFFYQDETSINKIYDMEKDDADYIFNKYDQLDPYDDDYESMRQVFSQLINDHKSGKLKYNKESSSTYHDNNPLKKLLDFNIDSLLGEWEAVQLIESPNFKKHNSMKMSSPSTIWINKNDQDILVSYMVKSGGKPHYFENISNCIIESDSLRFTTSYILENEDAYVDIYPKHPVNVTIRVQNGMFIADLKINNEIVFQCEYFRYP